MKKMIIRPATLADLDKLLSFEQGIITTERPFDVTLDDDPISYYNIAEMIAADNVEVAVAELNSEIIGSGYARIDEAKAYLKYAQYAYLGFMYVDPRHRGKGVNRQILEYLKHNLPAIKAYEKAGFSKLLVQMRMGI
jgi:GNAT superfamily N-acetyltransferase